MSIIFHRQLVQVKSSWKKYEIMLLKKWRKTSENVCKTHFKPKTFCLLSSFVRMITVWDTATKFGKWVILRQKVFPIKLPQLNILKHLTFIASVTMPINIKIVTILLKYPSYLGHNGSVEAYLIYSIKTTRIALFATTSI